jgi:hypothetical protein
VLNGSFYLFEYPAALQRGKSAYVFNIGVDHLLFFVLMRRDLAFPAALLPVSAAVLTYFPF